MEEKERERTAPGCNGFIGKCQHVSPKWQLGDTKHARSVQHMAVLAAVQRGLLGSKAKKYVRPL